MTIKIGLIGCGGITQPHIYGYQQIADEARVTAVSDVVEENAKRRAEQVGGAQIYSDYHTMLAESGIDAVDICLPHHLHKDAIVSAAAAGKHILCEKPLCLTLEEATAVEKAVKENGVTLMCAHNQLFMPTIQKAHQLITENVLGQIYAIRTADSFYHKFDPNSIGWRGNRAMIGGGELIDTGYHPTYMLLYLANSTPTEVTAMLSQHRLSFMDGEDSAQVLVRFANGAVGNIVTSWAQDMTSNTERFSVRGELGHLYGTGENLYLNIRGEEPQVFHFPQTDPGKPYTFANEIKDFAACLREHRRPVNNETDGINVLKVILGAYTSEGEKRTVAL